MSAEIRRLIDNARNATSELRDAAREGREIGFRKRDPLVMAIHNALDKLEALLPPAGSPLVEALVQQWRARTQGQAMGWNEIPRWIDEVDRCADQLEAALKAAPLVRQEEDLARRDKWDG